MRKWECETCELQGAFCREREFNEFCQTLRAIQNQPVADLLPLSDMITIDEEELRDLGKDAESAARPYDVLVLFSGGKDSTYLLWYLNTHCKLRILVGIWETPFMNSAIRANIENIKAHTQNLDFVTLKISREEVKRKCLVCLEQTGIPCPVCNWYVQVLFYPIAVGYGIPLILDGLELCEQAAFIVNINRDFGRRALRARFFWALFKYLGKAFGRRRRFRNYIARRGILRALPPKDSVRLLSGAFANETCNLKKLFRQVKTLPEMRFLVKKKIKGLTFDELRSVSIFGDWADVKETIVSQFHWKYPEDKQGLLHTSCNLEDVKDFIQGKNYGARAGDIPQYATQLILARFFNIIDTPQAVHELRYRRTLDPAKIEQDLAGIQTM